MGGGFALMTAGGFDVASANYAHLPEDLDGVLRGACPIVASYGGKDRTLRGTAAELESALERAGVPHDVEEYPEGLPTPQLPPLRPGGVLRSPGSATTGRRRRMRGGGIPRFFDAHLGDQAETR